MEKSKRSEATLTARMNHEDDHGMNGDSNLSQTMCVHLNKENSQGTLTDNKEERLRKTKDLQCMMTHALASTTLTDFPSVSGHFTRCWDFRSALRVTPCRDLHCENGLVRCCLYTPRRLQQTDVSCKRSNCNKIREKIVKIARLRFYPKTANNPRSIMSLCIHAHLWTFI